jgi:hypothetical protein
MPLPSHLAGLVKCSVAPPDLHPAERQNPFASGRPFSLPIAQVGFDLSPLPTYLSPQPPSGKTAAALQSTPSRSFPSLLTVKEHPDANRSCGCAVNAGAPKQPPQVSHDYLFVPLYTASSTEPDQHTTLREPTSTIAALFLMRRIFVTDPRFSVKHRPPGSPGPDRRKPANQPVEMLR